ncbi:MAG: hypothetical protein ACTSX9_07465 [Candidatus Njordarchaeales archaeon]
MDNNSLKAVMAAERLFLVLDYEDKSRKYVRALWIIMFINLLVLGSLLERGLSSYLVVLFSAYLSLYIYATSLGLFLVSYFMVKETIWRYKELRMKESNLSPSIFKSLVRSGGSSKRILLVITFLLISVLIKNFTYGLFEIIISLAIILLASSLMLELIIPATSFEKGSTTIRLHKVYKDLRRRTFLRSLVVVSLVYFLNNLALNTLVENNVWGRFSNLLILLGWIPVFYISHFIAGYLLGSALSNRYIYEFEFERETRDSHLTWLGSLLVMGVLVILSADISELLPKTVHIEQFFATYYLSFLFPLTIFFWGLLRVFLNQTTSIESIDLLAGDKDKAKVSGIVYRIVKSLIMSYALINVLIGLIFLFSSIYNVVFSITIRESIYVGAILGFFYGMIISILKESNNVLIGGAKIILVEKKKLIRFREKRTSDMRVKELNDYSSENFDDVLLELEKITGEIQNSI